VCWQINFGVISHGFSRDAARRFSHRLKADIAASHARCNKRASPAVLRLIAGHIKKFEGENR
jgi:hypothetical protein